MDTPMDTPKLEPCPVCGADAQLHNCFPPEDGASCSDADCWLFGRVVKVSKWNTRVLESPGYRADWFDQNAGAVVTESSGDVQVFDGGVLDTCRPAADAQKPGEVRVIDPSDGWPLYLVYGDNGEPMLATFDDGDAANVRYDELPELCINKDPAADAGDGGAVAEPVAWLVVNDSGLHLHHPDYESACKLQKIYGDQYAPKPLYLHPPAKEAQDGPR